MGKGTIIGNIKCPTCGNTVFELPDDDSDRPIVKCRCGTVLGPFGDLKAFAKNEPHTGINAKIEPPLKPVR